MRGREPHVELREILDGIVAEIRQPGIFLAREADADVDLVLVHLPRNAEVFEPLGERRPTDIRHMVDIRIVKVGRRLRILLGADRAGPQVAAIGRRAGQDEQKCWSQIVKASASA